MSNTPEVMSREITMQNNPDEVIEADLRSLHLILCKLETAWHYAETIDDTCKLTLTTLKVMEHRRKTLGIDVSPGKQVYLTPYDS